MTRFPLPNRSQARPAPAAASADSLLGSWAWGGVALGTLCALLAFAPARWVAGAVSAGSHGQLVLDEPRGTVWNGSATVIFTGGAGSEDATALPGRLEWALRPRWSGLGLALQAECCTSQALNLRATPRLTGGRVELADSLSTWPAQLLAGLGAPWNTVQAQGRLQLQSTGLGLEWRSGRLLVSGSAELQAQDMSSRLSTLRPMGSYRLRLTGGDAPGLVLDTLEGALQLSGSGQWVGSRLRFRGEASAAPEREAALANLLNIIGRRNGPRSLIQLG